MEPETYGPFWRKENRRSQTPDVAAQQQASGELWGLPPWGQHRGFPAVKAFSGPLPLGVRGIEFWTDVPPDPPNAAPPGESWWRGPRPGVRVEDGYAKIAAIITTNTQT